MSSIIVQNLSIKNPEEGYTYRDLNFNHFDTKRDQLAVDDLDSIRNAIHNLFIVKRGSRVRDPEFGSNLDEYIYQYVNEQNARFLAEDIEEILIQEPRIIVVEIIVDMDKPNGIFEVSIVFIVPALSREKIALQLSVGEKVGLELSSYKVNDISSRSRVT